MPKENLKDHIDGNEIDLSMSSLETVPVKELAALPKVTNVDLSCNLITTLPDAFCSLIHITRLDLSKNSLEELPSDFGFLDNLQHLDLLGNQLKTLPRSFCRLKKLKWLDMKDNPLENGLKKNAGDCLDERQCKQCATRILMYMTDLDAQLDLQWQKKMMKKREEEAKKKEKEENEKQKKRVQKKAEKERRRRELENKRNQERLAQSDDTSDEELKAEQENSKTNHKAASHSKGRQSGNCLLFVLFSFLALVIALLIAIDFHCQEANKDHMCVSYWLPTRSNVTAALFTSKKVVYRLYSTHIAPYFNK